MAIKTTPLVSIMIICALGINLKSNHIYLLLFGVAFICGFSDLVNKKKIRINRYDLIPISMLLIWVYGVIVGVANKNQVSFIFQNFFGLTLYSMYFFLKRYSVCTIGKIIVSSAILLITQSIVFIILPFWGIYVSNTSFGMKYLDTITQGSSTGQLRALFNNQLVLFVLVAVYLYSIFNNKLKTNKVLGILCVITLVFITASKGFILGFVIIFILVYGLHSYYGRKISYRYIPKAQLVAIVLVLLFSAVMISTNYISVLTAIIDTKDVANIDRLIQLKYLVNDITLWGNGLGAVIPGIVRNVEKPYGFELVYLNIVHKFGVISFILFMNYIITIIGAIRSFKFNKYYSITAIGCMGFLFPSIGNPFIFAPAAVMLHIIAIILISRAQKEDIA